MNKSAKIRELFDAGHSVQEISEIMGIRYQFAYNVVKHHVQQQEVVRARQEAAATGESPWWWPFK
jgi:hypothetical protein